MAGIKQPLQDVLAELAKLDVQNQDGQTVKLYSRVWNNQVEFEAAGESYVFPKPAAFVEVVNNPVYEEIGVGFASADILFRIHLVHEYYNQDGTFEQDLAIFDLRDRVVALLSHYKPTACGLMVRTSETASYEHTNIYEYLIDFVCNFTDSKGSPYDPHAGKYLTKQPPTELNLSGNYNIPQ